MATFLAPRKVFQNAVARVVGTIPRRQVRDVLRNVRVSVNGHVELDATTGKASHHISADWDRDGEAVVLVNGKQLADAAKLANGSEVLVDVSPDGVRIGGVSIPAYVAKPVDPKVPEVLESFPPLGCVVDSLATVATVEIDAACLRAAIDAVEYAADDESTRYALGGIQFDFSGPGQLLRLATTDSRRLAVCEAGIYGAAVAPPASIVVPIDVCRRLSKSLDKITGAVVLTVYCTPVAPVAGTPIDVSKLLPQAVRFVLPGGITVDTDTVQGRFPDWRKVVPNYSDGEVTISAAELVRLCKASRSVTTDESRGVDWTFARHGFLTAKASSALGTVEESASVETRNIVGPESITLDPRYLMEYAACLPKKARIVMKFADTRLCPTSCYSKVGSTSTNFESSPIMMTEETTRTTYITMPLSPDR